VPAPKPPLVEAVPSLNDAATAARPRRTPLSVRWSSGGAASLDAANKFSGRVDVQMGGAVVISADDNLGSYTVGTSTDANLPTLPIIRQIQVSGVSAHRAIANALNLAEHGRRGAGRGMRQRRGTSHCVVRSNLLAEHDRPGEYLGLPCECPAWHTQYRGSLSNGGHRGRAHALLVPTPGFPYRLKVTQC